MRAALLIGFIQFCVNYNSVYLAERHITSGIVATISALMLIPNSLLGWAFLGQRPGKRFTIGSVVAVAGIGLLCIHEFRSSSAPAPEVVAGRTRMRTVAIVPAARMSRTIRMFHAMRVRRFMSVYSMAKAAAKL